MAMKLVTHSGTFHYDEVLATAMLEMIYDDAEVVRTRDSSIIETGDIVYDVGGVFDPGARRFDHHQKSFEDTYSPRHAVKLSSCGLIYKYFCDALFAKYNFGRQHALYEDVKEKIYEEFFLYADALDNGISIGAVIRPRTVGDLVARFNVYDCRNGAELEEMQNCQFRRALEIVRLDFTNYIEYIFREYVPSYAAAYGEMSRLSGDIYITRLKISSSLILEIDEKLRKNLKYVIYANKNEYRVLALPVAKGSFETRAPLLREWRGLRDEELASVSGIPGCIFVHATGFTGGSKTLEGAIKMCRLSLNSK